MNTSLPKSTAGKLFIVSGLSNGREIFLGKAIDEPYEEYLTLEGKLLSCGPQGTIVARPFLTTANFYLKDPAKSIQHISHPKAHEEAIQLLNLSVAILQKSSYPLLHRWIESGASVATNGHATTLPAHALPWNALTPALGTTAWWSGPWNMQTHTSPFTGFYQGFQTTAEQFRRAIFHSRAVNTTRELDKVAELEGDLAIEIGKVTNQIAIKFHQLAARESELHGYLDAYHGADMPLAGTRWSMAGWIYLLDRLTFAKNWARRAGKSPLVRDINVLIKEGIFGISEVILDHCNSLDTLITETFSQYGISYELYGELSPFAGYTGSTRTEYEPESMTSYAAGTI